MHKKNLLLSGIVLFLLLSPLTGHSLHLPKVLNKDQIFQIKKLKQGKSGKDKFEFDKFLFVGIKNDNYFLLDDLSESLSNKGDDFGQTHAFTMEYVWRGANFIHSINFETALFTRAMSTEFQGDKKVVTQQFREISSLEYSFQNVNQSHFYTDYTIEIGLINDRKPIRGLALWQQSGQHGDGGFHDLVGVDSKLHSQPSGGRHSYVGTQFTIGKVLPFGLDKYSFFNRINLTTEAKLRLRSRFEGSHFTVLAKGAYNFIKHKDRPVLTLNLQEEAHYYLEETTTGTTTSVGLQYDAPSWGTQINFSFPYGKQNERFYKFADKDVIINLNLYTYF
jgi:hypothetical protein